MKLKLIKGRGGKPDKWLLDVTVKGRRIRRFAGLTKEEAKHRYADYLKAGQQGKLEETLKPPKRLLTTSEEFARSILDSETWKQKRSHDRDEYSFAHLRDFFKGKSIQDIKPAEITVYINKRRNEDKVAPATVNRELAFLRTIFYIAMEDGLIAKNPIKVTRTSSRKWKLAEDGSREQKVLEHLTPDKVRFLIESAAGYLKPILKIAALTGMRRGEILKMKWQDINFELGTIRVPAENAKSKRERYVDIDPVLYRTLDELPRKNCYVFPSPQTGRPRRDIVDGFKTACKKAAICHGRKKGIVFHDLRHYAASRLVKVTDVVTASKILGHGSLDMTLRYCHPSAIDRRLAVERVGEDLFPSESRQKVGSAEKQSNSKNLAS